MNNELRQKLTNPGSYQYKELSFECHKNVFSPREFPSTKVFSDWGHKYINNQSKVLEVGCGVGVLSISLAIHKNCLVTAVDLDTNAVENTRLNIKQQGASDHVNTFVSDVYSNVGVDEKFDYILWNSAFMYTETGLHEDGESIFYDDQYKAHTRYLKEAEQYLSPQGRLLLGFGSIGDEEKLSAIAKDLNLTWRILETTTIQEGDFSYEYSLIEFLRHG